MYIIKYNMMVDGKPTRAYHFGIQPTGGRNMVSNAYSEMLTDDWTKAMKFYEMEEATRIIALFRNDKVVGKVYKISTIKDVERRRAKEFPSFKPLTLDPDDDLPW